MVSIHATEKKPESNTDCNIVAKRFGWSLNEAAISSMTRGYVGDTQFAVLPTIEAIHTMIITVVVQLVHYSVNYVQDKHLTRCFFRRLYYKNYGENPLLITSCLH